MKKKIFAVLLSVAVAFSVVGCSGGGDAAGSTDAAGSADASESNSAAEKQEESKEAGEMSKDDYLAQVEALNPAAEDFMNAIMAFTEAANAGNVDKAVKEIESIRQTKQPFLDFGAIANPPKGYEEAHKNLAEKSTAFGEFIDGYADLIQGGIDGTIDQAAYTEELAGLTSEVTTLTTDLANAMAEVQGL